MIIDRLFGLEILGHIKWKIKYKLKILKEYLDNIDTEISVLERSIQTSNQELENLNEKLKTAGEEKRKDLIEKIEKYQEFIANAGTKLQEISEKDKEIQDAMSLWNSKLSEQKAEERILFYDKKVSAGEKIRLGVIGFGVQGHFDLTTALKVPGVELAGICDLYTGRLDNAKETYGKDLDYYEK
jgi:predicted nuclease with TOPRIM domain